MVRMKRSKLMGRVAWPVVLSFVVPILGPAFAAEEKAASGEGVATVAVVEVRDRGGAGAQIVEDLSSALVLALVQSRAYEPVSPQEVKKAIEGRGLKPPILSIEGVEIAKATKAQLALQAKVVQFVKPTVEQAGRLDVTGEVCDVTTGQVIVKTRAIASVPRRHARSSSVADMIERVAAGTVSQMESTVLLKGIVLSKPKPDRARINIGDRGNLQAGAEVVFLENGSAVAQGEVISVDSADSVVQVKPADVASRVSLGATVRVLYNPPREARKGPSESVRHEREARKSSNTLLGLAAVLALAFIVGGRDKSEGIGVPAPPVSGVAAHVVIAPTQNNIRGWDVLGAETELRITVTDKNGNAAKDGTKVRLTASPYQYAQVVPDIATTTNGSASARLVSNAPEAFTDPNGVPSNGQVTVTASVEGAAAASVRIIMSGPPSPTYTNMTIAPSCMQAATIDANGNEVPGGSASVTMTVYDGNNNPVVPGTSVSFTSTGGTTVESSEPTDEVGVARATVQAGQAVGTAYVTGSVEGVAVTQSVSVLVACPASMKRHSRQRGGRRYPSRDK